jgi:hypothetical protein
MRVGSRDIRWHLSSELLPGTMRLGENSKMKQTCRRSFSGHRRISRWFENHRYRRGNVLKTHVPVVLDELSEDPTLLLCVGIIENF